MTVNTNKKIIDYLLKKNNDDNESSSSTSSPTLTNNSSNNNNNNNNKSDNSSSIRHVIDTILVKSDTLSSPNLKSTSKKPTLKDTNKDSDNLFEEPEKLESNVSSIISILIELKKSLFNVVQEELEISSTKNKGIINIQNEIKALDNKQKEVIRDINKIEDGIVSRIDNTVTYDRELRERLSSIETTLEILDFFEQYEKLVRKYDEAIKHSKFIAANEILLEMNRCIIAKPSNKNNNNNNIDEKLKILPFELTTMLPQPRILPSIKDQLKKRKNHLKTNLLELFTHSIQVNSNEIQLSLGSIEFYYQYQQQHNSTNKESLKPDQLYSLYCTKLIESLESIGLFDFLISSFSLNLFETFLKPNLIELSNLINNPPNDNNQEKIYNIFLKNDKDNNNSNNEDIKIHFKLNENFKDITIETILHLLENLFKFISINIFGNNKNYIVKLGKEIWSPLSTLLLNLLLKTRIPKDLKELKEFLAIEESIKSFEKELEEIGFLVSNNQDSKILSLFVENIEFHYSERKRTLLLSKARDIILKDRYSSIQSNDSIFGIFQENNGIIQGYYFNNCLIFESTHQLLTLCVSALKEALDSSNLVCKKLYQGCRDIFELYHSIYLKFHFSKLDKVPSLASLFYNSCSFLSHSFLVLSMEFQSIINNNNNNNHNSKEFKLYTFIDFSPKFKKLGEDFFSKYIQEQLKWILSFLTDYCNQLENTKDNNTYQKIQTNITNMNNELNRLSNIWKENFPREVYFELISKFSESIISTIIKMILKLQNIEMVETQRLSELILSLYPVFIKFFLFPGESEDLHKNRMKLVKSWKKLWQIKMVLELPLKEIVALYNNGHLNKLTNNELRLMILSIFDDFELKTNFVSKLIQNN
ncbi:hypothetical protein DICPUDRAFT_99889 [Dictyostelium purpureum]|uniref:Uncharacterized protein n=1 Tax=Dictyostelium purpureum TaxID=5786 RepID=F1A3I8_DICPU|nr:uncharacterized protein DICPUDRAFT_99889 [Dictyostelium purpureum]EGC29240.1 hypothetical protein DICPUDRAFT_99889 [Dictyostelium purpureum]|eukprot:XP_003294232.1 hypothetical protein DICPUDRAFT_99889 [Dictyostelium purpureum]